MITFILIVIGVIVVVIFLYFNYYSATRGMTKSNLDAFFKATSEGLSLEDAMNFMILTRYGSFPQKRGDFMALYALWLTFFENPETNDTDYSDVFDFLSIILSSFHLYHKIPEDTGEKERVELEMLRHVISLMHLYESDAIYKSPQSYGFPTVKFMDNFICTIDQGYYKRVKNLRSGG